ncbi:MAG: sugar phosphate nucleotidyltransferase [Candidatus Woesearchaeota archaeon]
MKERITITLDNDLLNQIDGLVDERTIKNRSHAIELLINKGLNKKSITKAILLAGGSEKIGLGKSKIPTCCGMINERTLLEHIIYSFKKYNINEFIVIARKSSIEIIKETLKNSRVADEIIYLEEKEPMGTSGALNLASEYITGPVVVCNTNSLFQIDLTEMFNFHKNTYSLATIALTTTSNTKNFGVVELNGSKIFSFEEKPSKKKSSNLINAGCYIVEPEVIDLIPEGYSKFEIDLFPKLARQEQLAGFVFYGKWIRIDNTEDLEDAEKEW